MRVGSSALNPGTTKGNRASSPAWPGVITTGRWTTDIGSIGYAVRPDQWGKGYGTAILCQGLAIAKSLSMEKALLTVNEENKPSIHIIEKLGGILSDTIDAYNEVEGDHLLRRYWITL